MLIVSYDFSSDKVRAKFAKFLSKYGRRLQYSVFEVKNSDRVLQNILNEVELVYKKKFTNADSILIFELTEASQKYIHRYGYAVNEEKSLVIFS